MAPIRDQAERSRAERRAHSERLMA
jgi:hypothetical protein